MIKWDEATRRQFNTVRIIAIMMLVVAPLVYAAITFFVRPMEAIDSGSSKMLLYILLIVAVVMPASYPIIERVQLANFRKTRSASKMTPAQLYTTQQVTRFAIIEAVFIFALVVYFVTSQDDWFWYFYPIGVFWTVQAWPTETKFEKYLEKVGQS